MQNTLFARMPEQTTEATPLYFYDIASLLVAIKAIYKDETTFEQFCQLRDWVATKQDLILMLINKLTIAEIKKHIYLMRSGETKAYMVKEMYSGLLSTFSITGSGMVSIDYASGQTYESQVIKGHAAHTPETYEAYKEDRRQKAAAFKKCMDNPETLEEFKKFVQYKGEAALNSEQKEIFDELRTGISREQKAKDAERKAQVAAVELSDTDMIIIKSRHTKKLIDLWVVKLSEKVEKYIFNDLNSRAKQLGGYYSSFRGNGAIPGFTFDREDAAQLFIQIKDGDVNAAELRAAINIERTQQRAENLQVKAEGINDRATEDLNRNRKDNTVRRARMASHAEQRAAAEVVFSITLDKIGQLMAAGEVKHLEKLSTIVQLEELEGILSLAKWAYIRVKNIKSDDFVFTPEVIEYAIFPYPTLWKENIIGPVNRMQHDKGKVLAAKRMGKHVSSLKEDQSIITVREGRGMEDFKTLFLCSSKGLDIWQCQRYKNMYASYQRIVRLGITTIYELRTALRELVKIKEGVQLTPEQLKEQQIRELERKFIGKKIDGFFPTGEELGREVVIKAGIVEGDRILEPEAGLGHLAEIITELHPDNELTCIEYYQPLTEALRLKGFTALNEDFLQHTGRYDKIIMNPPFENLQDIDHVNHAWSLLAPGGRIVAIMAANKEGDREKVKTFMAFVDQYGTWEKNPEGSFVSAFRPTGVNTITVVLDKPAT